MLKEKNIKKQNFLFSRVLNRRNLLVIFIIFLLALGQVIFSNKMTTLGKRFEELEKETLLMESENKKLEQEIISLSSLERLKAEAQKLNYSQKVEIANLSKEKEIALYK